jgi:hypothetical protein
MLGRGFDLIAKHHLPYSTADGVWMPCHDGMVPFHLGKHKPVAPPKRAAFGVKVRLQVAALGALGGPSL